MITIEYCGYHTHNPDRDLIFRPSGSSSYLFLLVLSPMRFTFQEKQEPMRAEPAPVFFILPAYTSIIRRKRYFSTAMSTFSAKKTNWLLTSLSATGCFTRKAPITSTG